MADQQPPAKPVLEIAPSLRPDGKLQWERLDGETDKSWAAFELYRELPTSERSLAKVHAAVYGENAGNIRAIEKWSSAWAWPARARAWDDHKARVAVQESLAAVQAAAEARGEVAIQAIRIAKSQLAVLEKRVSEGLTLTVRETVVLAELSFKLTGGEKDERAEETIEQLAHAIAKRRTDPRTITD